MTDDTAKRGGSDRSRINVEEDYELQYWSQKWGISQERLRAAVGKVGPMAKDVAQELGKSI